MLPRLSSYLRLNGDTLALARTPIRRLSCEVNPPGGDKVVTLSRRPFMSCLPHVEHGARAVHTKSISNLQEGCTGRPPPRALRCTSLALKKTTPRTYHTTPTTAYRLLLVFSLDAVLL